MSQKSLNKAIKSWLESEGFRVIITGGKHQFPIQVADLFPIKNFQIPDIIGLKDSNVVVVETENKLDKMFDVIAKCLIWKVMATFVYIAYPEDKCKNKKFSILEKYGIGLLSVSENVREVVNLMEEDGKPKFSVNNIHPLDVGREQDLAKMIRRMLNSNN